MTSDGLPIELDRALRLQAGYRWAGRLSRGVAELLMLTPEEEQRGQSVEKRLWVMLCMARLAILRVQPGEGLMPFEVAIGQEAITLWAGVDMTRGLAIHILGPGECWTKLQLVLGKTRFLNTRKK